MIAHSEHDGQEITCTAILCINTKKKGKKCLKKKHVTQSDRKKNPHNKKTWVNYPPPNK